MTRGLGLIVYGNEKIGKTSFALQFPKPVKIISLTETGFEDLDDVDEVPDKCFNENVEDWEQFLIELRSTVNEDVNTVVVDSLSGVGQYMKKDILERIYKADNKGNQNSEDEAIKQFGSFNEGWSKHSPIWAEEMETTCNLLRSKKVNVILLGHVRLKKGKHATMDDYQMSAVDLDDAPYSVLKKWAQAILFMTMDFQLRATKLWKGKATESKVTDSIDDGDVTRLIYTTLHPSHVAGNRLKTLPPFIQMGASAEAAYANFTKELPPKIQEGLSN